MLCKVTQTDPFHIALFHVDMLVLKKTFPNFLKVKIQSIHILPFFSTEKKKRFQNPPTIQRMKL